MDIVALSIEKPVSVTVGVILLVVFGLIGFGAIPIQLTPSVDRPVITVKTSWPGRSPEEIVDQITKEQEERLKNVTGLDNMRSTSREGEVEITLDFFLGTDIDRALQEVADALRQVPEYPEEVTEPTIKAAEGAAENAIAWMIIDIDPEKGQGHQDFDVSTLFDAVERDIKPYLERIDGVAEINIFGGRKREVRVLVDPLRLAQRQLTHSDVIEALRAENRNVSAGTIAEGKRDYRVRLVGQFTDTREVLETIISYRDGKPIYVRDVATVEIGYQKVRSFVRAFGQPSIAFNCIRQSGANVMSIMADLHQRLEEVRADLLPNLDPEVGPVLRLRQVYDETVYIHSAVNLVTQNLWFGGAIAAIVLFIFLRSFVATGIIALAIPISIIGTFLALLALGRSLNVISLAGLAFAVGMVVDNAIVVLENIHRRLQTTLDPREAALSGGREVWGAILASTLTTVAVFVPVLTIQDEAGQLFRDISLAIVASVSLSLVVSITVIPTACAAILRRDDPEHTGRVRRTFRGMFGLVHVGDLCARGFGGLSTWLAGSWRGWTLRPLVILVVTFASLYASNRLMPPLDYLPAGNRNLVFGILLIPPGYSVGQKVAIAERIESGILAYAQADIDDPASVAALPPIQRFMAPDAPFDPVPVENFFIVGFGGGMFAGATSQDPQVVTPVAALLTGAMNRIPDAFGFARQSSIFGRGVGGGNQINLEVSGPQLDRVITAAGFMFGAAAQRWGYSNVRPDPSNFNLSQPEWRLTLNRSGREFGLSNRDLAVALRGFIDGAFAGDFQLDGENVDMLLLPTGGRLEYKEQLAGVPIVTPRGRVVPIDSVIDITPAQAPQEIQRIEELASVTIQIVSPDGVALEQTQRDVRDEVIAAALEAGLLDSTMRVRMEGTAAKLDQVKEALFGTADLQARPGDLDLARLLVRGVLALGALAALVVLWRALRRRDPSLFYGVAGALLLATVLAALLYLGISRPYLATARIVWALLVTYLLMCSLFESFLYPFVIMFTVPLAIVGGFAGLRIVHDASLADPTVAPQQLDVLTMLGFVILIGVVVNNAILIVHQGLNFIRNQPDLSPTQAIGEAVRTRVRPIFMSTLTSVGGMLPLVLMPGAGSEMYRGLGSVVVGGLLVSSIVTLLLVPLAFSLVLEMRGALGRAMSSPRA